MRQRFHESMTTPANALAFLSCSVYGFWMPERRELGLNTEHEGCVSSSLILGMLLAISVKNEEKMPR